MATGNNSKQTSFILAAFLFSGTSSLIYEVVWTRALSLVLGSTVYAVSTMLATFMAGLALGSYLGGKYSDRGVNLLFFFGICELGIGIFGLASIPLIYKMPSLYLSIYRALHLYPALFFTVQIFLCAIVMFIPTTLMGATFPFVCKKITANLAEVGRKVGDAYSVNTVGAVIGSLAAGFFLIPALGIKGATLVAAFLNLLVGITMLVLSRRGVIKPVVIAAPLFIVVALWSGTARLETSLVNFYNVHRDLNGEPYSDIVAGHRMDMEQVFYEERPEGAVRGFKTTDGSLALQVGGKLEGTTLIDLPNTVLLAYLPIASHPAPKTFLTIGLGAGVTLGAAKDALSDVDVVEINPGVVEAVARHGRPGLLDGTSVIVKDARNYLLTTDKKYDVISSEPSYPTESEVAGLYTKEFYELAATKLAPGGIYCQWLPYYLLADKDVISQIKTFGTVFSSVQLFGVRQSNDLILIGSKEPFVFSANELTEKVKILNTAHNYPLDYYRSKSPEQLAKIIKTFDIPLNTDDRPILEFSAVNNFLLGNVHKRKKE